MYLDPLTNFYFIHYVNFFFIRRCISRQNFGVIHHLLTNPILQRFPSQIAMEFNYLVLQIMINYFRTLSKLVFLPLARGLVSNLETILS